MSQTVEETAMMHKVPQPCATHSRTGVYSAYRTGPQAASRTYGVDILVSHTVVDLLSADSVLRPR